MSRQLIVMGVDVTDRVISWGSLDETKEVLLASPQILVASVEVELENADGLISTGKDSTCLFRGKTALDREFLFYFGNDLLFDGLVRAAVPGHGNRTLRLRAENELAKAMEATFSLTASNVDPGTAMLAVLNAAGLSAVVDQDSFLAAGAAAREAGAAVSLTIAPDREQSALSALRDLSELSGISVIVSPVQIRARAFRAFQGSEAGLRPEIKAQNVRVFGEISRGVEGFYDACVVKYGAASSVTAVRGQGERAQTFETQNGARVSVPDSASAQFFAQAFLDRSFQKDVATLTVDREFLDPKVGQRFPVTAENWGLVRAPFEVLETRRKLDQNEVELTLASLKVA